MALKFAPFAASQGNCDAYRNRPPVKLGAKGATVRLLQGALIDYGLDMPLSTGKYGRPDGIFGEETQAAVLAFQAGNGIVADGIAGTQTIQTLDGFLYGLTQKHATTPMPKKAPRTSGMPRYILGTADPVIVTDAGAGVWNSKPKTATYLALRASLELGLLHFHTLFGRDALFHMFHYLHCSGATYTIDLEGMIASVPAAMERFRAEAEDAQAFVESLEVGRYDITATSVRGGTNPQAQSPNWYLATGYYDAWGKGRAAVTEGTLGREFSLDFEYRFHDRYNWDRGKFVIISGQKITDEFMGEFHRQGLAREFECVGTVRRRFDWRKGQRLSQPQLTTPVGGRS